jgi:Ca-activated chloride channel family protein
VLEWVRSTEPPEFKLNAFLSKIGRRPVEGLNFTSDRTANLNLIYPLEANVFPGSMAFWVGQYKSPMAKATFNVRGVRDGATLQMRATVPLPAQNVEHPQLPRTWAKARVDALLEKIEREGEDRATIDEIIRLSRKYKFVTPYTSFLAAPRALLRPRLIRPGDPVLRVHADESITSVVAMFPFGLVKKLRYLKEEDTWQTRFLAPTDLPDGTHQVRLLLRDKDGRVFRESKTFVIASKPPVVKVRLEKTAFRRGETVHVRASASETSRTVIARMYGVTPVNLRWSGAAGANAADLIIPAHLPAGRYGLTVTAEDFAHNIGSQEVWIEVLP